MDFSNCAECSDRAIAASIAGKIGYVMCVSCAEKAEAERAKEDAIEQRAAECEAIVKSLALSNPDATEDGEVYCAVCNQQIHCGWPSLSEHGEECAFARSRRFVEGK